MVRKIVLLLSLLLVSLNTPAFSAELSSKLEDLFHTSPVWSGADGAYSIDMGNSKALWLYGDTFIGTISGGKRIDNKMIHNSVSIQDIANNKMTFHWTQGKEPDSYFSNQEDLWIWPGDGAYAENKVYFFAKLVGAIPDKPDDPFGFDWRQDELIAIDNPSEDPAKWQSRRAILPFTDRTIHFGTACIIDQDCLYVLGRNEKSQGALLARISLSNLSDLNIGGFEFLLRKDNKIFWTRELSKASAVFDKAAAEASICKYKDLFVCVYSQNGMGNTIVARTAKDLTGPWSNELALYTIPEEHTERGFCYAAKAHPEQSSAKGQLALTYAINPGKIEDHAKDPYAYFPHVVYVNITDLLETQKNGHN